MSDATQERDDALLFERAQLVRRLIRNGVVSPLTGLALVVAPPAELLEMQEAEWLRQG